MFSENFFDEIPLWALFLLTLVLVLIAVEIGFKFGRRRGEKEQHERESSISTMVAAVFGLLAFMVAFTFGVGASRFETRRQLMLDEVNAIGTAWLRTDLLSDASKKEAQRLLKDYVDARLEAGHAQDLPSAIEQSEKIQRELWPLAVAEGKKQPDSVMTGLFIQSLNEVIDLHTKRLNAILRARIPASIWMAVYVITLLSMGAMGYQIGLSDRSRLLAMPALAVSFAVVIILIADLDRPLEGMLRVSQHAMADLRKSMDIPPP